MRGCPGIRNAANFGRERPLCRSAKPPTAPERHRGRSLQARIPGRSQPCISDFPQKPYSLPLRQSPEPPLPIDPSSNLRRTVMSINAQCDRVLPCCPWHAVWAIGPPRSSPASKWLLRVVSIPLIVMFFEPVAEVSGGQPHNKDGESRSTRVSSFVPSRRFPRRRRASNAPKFHNSPIEPSNTGVRMANVRGL